MVTRTQMSARQKKTKERGPQNYAYKKEHVEVVHSGEKGKQICVVRADEHMQTEVEVIDRRYIACNW